MGIEPLDGEIAPGAPVGGAPAPAEPVADPVALPDAAAVAPIARAADRHIATALRRLPGATAPPIGPADESPVGAAVATGPTTGSLLNGFTGGGDPFTTFEEFTAVFAVPAAVTGPRLEPEFVVPATVVSAPALAGAVPRPARSAADASVLASVLAPTIVYVLLV